MSLSKQAVADLAKSIRESRVTAFAYAKGDSSNVYPYLVGAYQATITHLIQSHRQDSTEVRAAFEYQPTDEEVKACQEEHARWQADYAARKAAGASA